MIRRINRTTNVASPRRRGFGATPVPATVPPMKKGGKASKKPCMSCGGKTKK